MEKANEPWYIVKYSTRHLIESQIIESEPLNVIRYFFFSLYTESVHIKRRLLEWTVIVITFLLAQSDPIKRWTLFITLEGVVHK